MFIGFEGRTACVECKRLVPTGRKLERLWGEAWTEAHLSLS